MESFTRVRGRAYVLTVVAAPEIIDVTSWIPVEQEEALGARTKAWLIDPASHPTRDLLFKLPREGGLEEAGADLWAEWVASRIGALLGIPIAPVHFALRGPVRGVLVGRVGADLRHGNQLLFQLDPNYAANAKGQVPGYTLTAIRDCLQPFHASLPGLTAYGQFAGYLTLDAVIANTDRHHENWAVEEASRTLVASYDHGVSLGYNVSASKRADPGRVARGGRTRHFPHRTSLVDLAHEALDLAGPATQDFWLTRVENLDLSAVSAILNSVPVGWMSDGSRTFVKELVAINRGRLLT